MKTTQLQHHSITWTRWQPWSTNQLFKLLRQTFTSSSEHYLHPDKVINSVSIVFNMFNLDLTGPLAGTHSDSITSPSQRYSSAVGFYKTYSRASDLPSKRRVSAILQSEYGFSLQISSSSSSSSSGASVRLQLSRSVNRQSLEGRCTDEGFVWCDLDSSLMSASSLISVFCFRRFHFARC